MWSQRDGGGNSGGDAAGVVVAAAAAAAAHSRMHGIFNDRVGDSGGNRFPESAAYVSLGQPAHSSYAAISAREFLLPSADQIYPPLHPPIHPASQPVSHPAARSAELIFFA